MTGMVQTDLAHPSTSKYKDEPADEHVSAAVFVFIFFSFSQRIALDLFRSRIPIAPFSIKGNPAIVWDLPRLGNKLEILDSWACTQEPSSVLPPIFPVTITHRAPSMDMLAYKLMQNHGPLLPSAILFLLVSWLRPKSNSSLKPNVDAFANHKPQHEPFPVSPSYEEPGYMTLLYLTLVIEIPHRSAFPRPLLVTLPSIWLTRSFDVFNIKFVLSYSMNPWVTLWGVKGNSKGNLVSLFLLNSAVMLNDMFHRIYSYHWGIDQPLEPSYLQPLATLWTWLYGAPLHSGLQHHCQHRMSHSERAISHYILLPFSVYLWRLYSNSLY